MYEGILYSIKAKILRSKSANAILRVALHGEKVVEIGKDVYMWRGKVLRCQESLQPISYLWFLR